MRFHALTLVLTTPWCQKTERKGHLGWRDEDKHGASAPSCCLSATWLGSNELNNCVRPGHGDCVCFFSTIDFFSFSNNIWLSRTLWKVELFQYSSHILMSVHDGGALRFSPRRANDAWLVISQGGYPRAQLQLRLLCSPNHSGKYSIFYNYFFACGSCCWIIKQISTW